MKTKKYRIYGTIEYSTWVEAESEEEALEIAEGFEPLELLDEADDYSAEIHVGNEMKK